VYGRLHDDYSPKREDWEPEFHSTIAYMLIREDNDPVGMFMVSVHNPVCFEVHSAFLPSAWGETTREAGKLMINYLWEQTHCKRIIGNIAESNRLSVKFALDLGMEIFGVNKKSFMKHGRLQDQICMGISKPE
jgi:RimJ/RimL family protein N-acetyltransferase